MIYNNTNISVYHDFQSFDFFYILPVHILVKDDHGQSSHTQRVERTVSEQWPPVKVHNLSKPVRRRPLCINISIYWMQEWYMDRLLLDLITLLLGILVLRKTSKSFDFSLNTIINLAKLLEDKPIIRLTLMEEWRLRDIFFCYPYNDLQNKKFSHFSVTLTLKRYHHAKYNFIYTKLWK